MLPFMIYLKINCFIRNRHTTNSVDMSFGGGKTFLFTFQEAEKIGKYSVWIFMSQFFKMSLNFLSRGYSQTSLMGTLILPDGPSFPRPLVWPHSRQLAAL